MTSTIFLLLCGTVAVAQPDSGFHLSSRNTEAPFCYVPGATRRWPIGSGLLAEQDSFTLSSVDGDNVTLSGDGLLEIDGLRMTVQADGSFSVTSHDESSTVSLNFHIG